MGFFEAVEKTTAVSWCITAIAAVVLLVVAIVKKAQAPNDAQNKRIDSIERDLTELRERLDDHDQYFRNDLRRFERIETGNRIMQRCMLALLAHGIDGNDIDSMRKAKQDLQDYLIEQ